MMLSMVGLKRAFIASGLILSMPWEDHFTKSTLEEHQEKEAVSKCTVPGWSAQMCAQMRGLRGHLSPPQG